MLSFPVCSHGKATRWKLAWWWVGGGVPSPPVAAVCLHRWQASGSCWESHLLYACFLTGTCQHCMADFLIYVLVWTSPFWAGTHSPRSGCREIGVPTVICLVHERSMCLVHVTQWEIESQADRPVHNPLCSSQNFMLISLKYLTPLITPWFLNVSFFISWHISLLVLLLSNHFYCPILASQHPVHVSNY